MTTTAVVPKTPYFINVTATSGVVIKAKKTSVSAIATTLGWTELTSEEIPAGKTLLGRGRLAALRAGCFGVNLVYAKTATREQVAKVLCSPTNADTIFTEGRTKTYAGKNIVRVEIPKRRVLVF
jgi:hypothetical protein